MHATCPSSLILLDMVHVVKSDDAKVRSLPLWSISICRIYKSCGLIPEYLVPSASVSEQEGII